jgi:NitT/TauT family transport system permease protein
MRRVRSPANRRQRAGVEHSRAGSAVWDALRVQSRIVSAASRVAVFFLVLLGLWALWEGYRRLWEETGWTRPFPVNDTTMPHLHTIVGALFEPLREGEPILARFMLDAALFTAKEAAIGFAIGAAIGFLLGALIARFAVLRRGVMPYVVASQTIPILALAPIVVVGLGSVSIAGWTPADWMRVAVIAAYLTFFPVTVNTVRGLTSADPAAVELMESYAAREWSVFWKLRVPAALPYLFSAFKVAATASVVGAVIGELPSSIQDGLGGWIINFNQYYALQPENLWAVNVVAALLGISFFLLVVLVERLVVHRPPEQLV